MTITDLKEEHSHGLFATHKNINQSIKYATEMVHTLPSKDRIGFYTAMYCLLNTTLAECEKLSLKEM